jgi:hypothetical protein
MAFSCPSRSVPLYSNSTVGIFFWPDLLLFINVCFMTFSECVVCMEPIQGAAIRAPCDHYYDQDCINDLFRHATHDEMSFPPKCCNQPIPIHSVKSLPPDLAVAYLEKEFEFGTLRRVYCATKTCSRFLGPRCDYQRRYYTCQAPDCGIQTCARCSRKVGKFHICRRKFDWHKRAVVSLGMSQGWRRCVG